MLQATAAVDHRDPKAVTPGRVPSRRRARWLFVVGAIGVIGVTIDLVQGPAAKALPAPTAHGAAPAALPIDESVVKNLIDSDSLEQGASVAAYDRSTEPSADAPTALAPNGPIADAAREPILSAAVHRPSKARSAVQDRGDDTQLEPGASVAAYGS